MALSRATVLIEPPAVRLRLAGTALNPVLRRYPKYQLQILAANIRSRKPGIHVALLDLKDPGPEVESQESTFKAIRYEGKLLEFDRVGDCISRHKGLLSEASVVAVSCTYSMERGVACDVIASVRRLAPKARIVAGGNDAIVHPSGYLNAGADVCVLGEGETALSLLASGTDPKTMRGVAFLEHGELRRRGRQPAHDLNDIVYPDKHLLRVAATGEYPDGPWPCGVGPRYAVLETSRGCNEACNFCSSSFVAGRFRMWSTDGVLNQLAVLKDAGFQTLLIADDNILYRALPGLAGDGARKSLMRLFYEMRSMGFAWTFYNGLQIGLLENEGRIDTELCDALFGCTALDGRFTGCFEIYLPLERLDPASAGQLPKLKPFEIQESLIRHIAGMASAQLNLGYIIGTKEDSSASLVFAGSQVRRLAKAAHESGLGKIRTRSLPWCFVPLPGTPARGKHRDYIRYDLSEHPELHSNYISVIGVEGVSPLKFTMIRRELEEEIGKGHLGQEFPT